MRQFDSHFQPHLGLLFFALFSRTIVLGNDSIHCTSRTGTVEVISVTTLLWLGRLQHLCTS
jgi:hypothetical protein